MQRRAGAQEVAMHVRSAEYEQRSQGGARPTGCVLRDKVAGCREDLSCAGCGQCRTVCGI